MTVPDYVPPAGPPTQAVHTDLANLYQWQGLTQDQLNSLRVRLITSVIQIVIQAITGFFIPGGGLSGATQQLQDWAEGIGDAVDEIPIVGDLLDDLIQELFGTSSILSTLVGSVIPGLDATKIISGILSTGQIPGLDVSKIVSGIFGAGFIPGLDTTKITSGTFAQSMVSGLPAALANLSGLFSSVDFTSGSFDPLAAILPYLNVTGSLGLADIGSTSQAIVDQFISGFVNAVGTGASLPDAFGVANIIGSQSFLGKIAFDVTSFLSNKPLNRGMLPTGTSTVGLDTVAAAAAAAGGTSPTTAVTQGNTIIGFELFDQAKSIGAISWLGNGIASITSFYVDIWKFIPATNTFENVATSGNALANLSATRQYNIVNISPAVDVEAGDILGAELIPVGGTHTVVALGTDIPNHPTVLPKNMAARHNMSGGTLTQPGRHPFSDRQESFTSAIDTSFWAPYSSGTMPSVASGRLVIPNANAGIQYTNFYNMGGKQAWIEVPQVITGVATTQFEIYEDGSSPRDFMRIYQINGTLFFDVEVAAVVNQTSVTYNATTHRWWRINFEDNANIIFETSTDGWDWTVRRTVAKPAAYDMTKMKVNIFGSTGGSGNALFDNYNMLPAANLNYSSTFPMIEFAVEATPTTGIPYHSPVVTPYDSSTTYIVEDWVNTIEAVPLGGGGGGWRGASGFVGKGGDAGNFNGGLTLTRGAHFTTGDSVVITVGAGGFGKAGGSGSGNAGTGGTTTISVNGNTISATGGLGATGSATSSGQVAGHAAGSITYNGQPYVGGGAQSGQGFTGVIPGGGGGGGAAPSGNGGAGAHGRGWLKKIQ